MPTFLWKCRPGSPTSEKRPGSRAGDAVAVGEAPVAEPRERLALRLRDVRPAVGRDRVPDVVVGRGDVEVAAQDQRLSRVARLVEPALEPLEPRELAVVERAADDPAVRRVEADEPDPADDARSASAPRRTG